MPKINGPGSQYNNSNMYDAKSAKEKKSSFGDAIKSAASGTLSTVASASKFVPGGGLVGAAAEGLKALLGGDSGGTGGNQDQLDKMWAMQRESQMFNMQYLELQTQMQADNRNFSTMSNLMKVRHDTAKSAINNMHV